MPGKIITFYSYKGGTGRSMLLANVAWILASRGKRVLTVDWDLEAPGLHRYLHPFLKDKELTSSPGVIDFVIDFAVEAMTPDRLVTKPAVEAKAADGVEANTPDRKDGSPDWYVPFANVLRYAAALDWPFPGGGAFHFISAGKQGPLYASRVNSFNWQNFYDRLGGGAFLDAVRTRMADEYDFVLIDSRTGVSDTSGICTVQMPDILVVCFTMNNQSIEGAGAVAASVFAQRRKEGDLLLPLIFPVPTRIDVGEKDKLDFAREYAQTKFGPFMEHISEQARYWGDVEILHFPFYSYEEVLATFGDKPGPANSLLAAAERITSYLTPGQPNTWASPSEAERQTVLAKYARQSSSSRDLAARQVEAAEREFLRLSPEDQEAAHRIFLRLVTPAPENEGGGATRSKWSPDDLGPAADRKVVDQLAQTGLISVEFDQNSHKEFVTVANDTLLERWPRMREWLKEDRDFLLWRQDLRSAIARWERLQRSDDGLLEGSLLREALAQQERHESYLSPAETLYIATSVALTKHRDVLGLLERLKVTPSDEVLLDTIHERIDDIGVDFFRAVVQQLGIASGSRKATVPQKAGLTGVTRQTWRNCSANQVAQPLCYLEPGSLDDLRGIVRRAAANDCKVKAIGSGHSCSDIALTTDFMVDMHGLNRPQPLESELLRQSADPATLFKTECGILMRDLNDTLDRTNLAMLNMGEYDGQTIGGVVSTSTQGSGIRLGPIESAVVSLVLLTAEDKLIQIEPANGITDPPKFQSAHPDVELKQDDGWFNSVVVSMGCMGIIYSVTLRVREKYWLTETRQLTTWDKVKEQIQVPSQPGSVFDSNRDYQVLINPHVVDGTRSCLVTIRKETDTRESVNPFKERNIFSGLFASVPGSLDASLFLFDEYPQLTPSMLNWGMKQLVDDGYVNVSHKVLNLGGANPIGAYSSEYGLPMDTCVQAVDKVLEIAERSSVFGNVYHTSPLSLRFVKASDAYLSMQYGRDTCMLEIPMINGTFGGNELLRKYEAALYQFGARPHWGKINFLTADRSRLLSMYPQLPEWLQVYRTLNASGMFDNGFTDRCGFSGS